MITIALFNNSSSLSIQNADIILKLLLFRLGFQSVSIGGTNWVTSKFLIRKCKRVSPGQNIVAVITGDCINKMIIRQGCTAQLHRSECTYI